MAPNTEQGGVAEKKIICWASPGRVEFRGLTATVKAGKLVGLRGTKDHPTPHKGCADKVHADPASAGDAVEAGESG
jgi:hypothetical protein